MKTLLLHLTLSLASCVALLAQSADPIAPTTPVVPEPEGFTMKGTNIVLTRAGVTQRVEKEVQLDGGVRVMPNGTIVLQDGTTRTLTDNQRLTLEGRIEELQPAAQATAPAPADATRPAGANTPAAKKNANSPMKKQGEEVGISADDGISISGDDVLVTKNGVSEQVKKELRLDNGTRVMPNGDITLPNGTQVTLRANQVLTFDGVLRETPPRPNTNPGRPNR